MNYRAPASESALQADRDTILDRITIPKEGEHVAVVDKNGQVAVGIYMGTIPARHDSSDWFQRFDRWIVADGDNVAHVPTEWIRNAVVEHTTS